MPKTTLDQHCINAIRILSMDAVQKANSGHPGMPLGMADVAYALWTRHLRHNPHNPRWLNRDRFILSAGHGSMLLYSLLYLTGYPLELTDLQQFRQWESRTPGHPEYAPNLGVETTTGPLGQGFANGVGMAIAAKYNAARFNRPDFPLFDHNVYIMVSDGDLMEGISHEAASLAGHLGLDKLIVFYDANRISIEGCIDLTFTENVIGRFETYHWHVQQIDGHDHDAIEGAIRSAKAETGSPHLIVCHTHIGYGSPNKQDTAYAHGEPLGAEEVRLTREALNWPKAEPFTLPDDVVAHYRLAIPRGEQAEAEWRELSTRYEQAYPEETQAFRRLCAGEYSAGWESAIPAFRADNPFMATRSASGIVLNALAAMIPELVGGSADLAPSNKTQLQDQGDFQKDTPYGRNLHFGVREHAMGGILNGMALYGGLRVYGSTFLVFSDYMRPAVRMAALMKLPVIYVWTHDSVYLGEDGPTHQPVEHLMSLRAIPGLTVIRPADANETAAAWRFALNYREGPVALILTRQQVPIIPEIISKANEGVARGAYIVRESPMERVDIILIATGSEVADTLAAQEILHQRRISARVVSMPSWERFEAQPVFYKRTVFPEAVIRRLAVEAGATQGWWRYVGFHGGVMGIDHFGASAPHQRIKQEFGFSAQDIAERAQEIMAV